MRAGVRPDPVARRGKQTFRVVDLDQEEFTPILNNSGEPIDGGGHRHRGISSMLATEVNEQIEKRTGKRVEVEDDLT